MEPFGLKYYVMREDLSRDLLSGIAPQDLEGIAEHIRICANVTRGEAVMLTERFVADLRRNLPPG
jgi:hypothetical protein